MLASPAEDTADALERLGRGGLRVQAGRRQGPGPQAGRRGPRLHPRPERGHRLGARAGRAGRRVARQRAHPRRRGHRAARRRPAALLPDHDAAFRRAGSMSRPSAPSSRSHLVLRRAPHRRPEPPRALRPRPDPGARGGAPRRSHHPAGRHRRSGPAASLLAESLAAGHEGLMAKSLDAAYDAGRRGAGWLKLKPAAHARPGGHRRRVGQRPPPGLAVATSTWARATRRAAGSSCSARPSRG